MGGRLESACVGIYGNCGARAARAGWGSSSCAGSCESRNASFGLSGDDGLQWTHEPDCRSLLSDGRVFVAEKSGVIKVFDSVSTRRRRSSPTCGRTSTTTGTGVSSGWRSTRTFPTKPYVYVLYTYDHVLAIGAPSAPPAPGPTAVPTPPGATTDGCVVSGRLSRLQAAGDVMTGSEQVLIEDWCQQYPSHSIGTVAVRPRRRAVRERR